MAEETKIFGMPAERGRWLFVVLGFVINMCLGSVYAYSVFKKPVEQLFNCSATQGNMPFMLFLASFALLMFFGGRFLEKYGPRKVGVIGGAIVGLGWILSYFSTSITMLMITYGIIAGAGVGLAYGGPISVAARWFPDKKGLAVGLTVAGFGGSPFIMTTIASNLIKAHGPLETFMYLGIVFLVLAILLSLPLRFPVSGWKPSGWTPSGSAATRIDFSPREMVKTKSFWGLFLCYTFGCLAGLMAIGISKPVSLEIVRVEDAVATILVSVFAIFNGLGRPLFGFLTDKITPRGASLISLIIILLASVGMLSVAEGNSSLYTVCFIGFWLCLGGWLAIAPTATATFFGTKNYSRNYGIVFFAYGLGAILGNIISGQAKDLFGSYTYAFYPTAGLAAVGIILSLLLIKPPQKA